MLRSLIGSRAGRRIIAVVIIALLVIASLSIYLQMSQQRNVSSLTKHGGSGYITGMPQSVNLTATHSWDYPLTLVVTESYLSGIVLNVTQNSTYSNAEAYFTTSTSHWNSLDGNLSLQSSVPYYTAGERDGGMSLVVQGNENATGWIGISVTSVVGNVTPAFFKVVVYGYVQPSAPSPYIQFGNLPATVTVNSSSSGQYDIIYHTSGTTGAVSWQTNQTWIAVATLNGTNAVASYSAPDVASNSTFVVNITATAGGVTNSSTLTFIVVVQSRASITLDNLPVELNVNPGESGTYIINYTAVNIGGQVQWSSNQSWVAVTNENGSAAYANYTVPQVSSNSTLVAFITAAGNGATASSTITFNVTVNATTPPPAPSISFDNLPATITVPSGSAGTYIINYTAVNIGGQVQWSSNQSWVAVTNENGSAAYANYTVPQVSSNSTFVVNITATAGGVTNSSTLTFLVIAPQTPHQGEIELLNLPATIRVASGSSGTFTIEYAASGISGGLTWNSTLPWVEVTTVNSSTAYANYTAPSATPEFNTSSGSGGFYTIYTAGISVVSGNGVTNSSTLTFNVTAPYVENTTATITTLICLNNSVLRVHVDGGIHIAVFIPANQSNTSLLIYTVIVMNNSTLEASVDGGVHVNVYASTQTNLTIYDYTLIYMRNSSLSVRIDGGIHFDVCSCSGVNLTVVDYTHISSSNSTIRLHLGHMDTDAYSQVTQGSGPAAAGTYQPFFTEICLNNSTMHISIDGGIHVSFTAGQSSGNVTAIYTDIELNNSRLCLRIEGGVYIDLVKYGVDQQVLHTVLQLNNTQMEIEIQGIRIPSGGEGCGDGGHGDAPAGAGSGQAAAERGIAGSPTMIKLAHGSAHSSLSPQSSPGQAHADGAPTGSHNTPSALNGGPPHATGPPEDSAT